MKILSKLFVVSLLSLCALSVSAQCVDDEKEAKKLQELGAKTSWSNTDRFKYFDREIKKSPNCFYLYMVRGSTLLTFVGRPYDALADFKKAQELAPLTTSQYWRSDFEYYAGKNGALPRMMGEIGTRARKEQLNQLCIDAFTLALTYKTTSDFLTGRGDCNYNSKQYESASSDYLQGLELLSVSDAGSVMRGLNAVLSYPNIPHREKFFLIACRVRPQLKEFDGAMLDCQEALKINPDLTEAKELIVSIIAAKGRNDLAMGRKRLEDNLAAENAETNLKNKMAKDDPLLFQAYSEAIEKKNYQYISRILANKEFECVGCYAPTIESAATGNTNTSYQFYNFSFFIKFLSSSDGILDAAFQTRMKYDVKEVGARDCSDCYHPGQNRQSTLGNELWFGKYTVVSVIGSQLSFRTVESSKINSSLLEFLRIKPYLIEGLKWNCDCEEPERYYIPASKITESFLNTSVATIKSINYQGKITLQMLDNRGEMQTFVSK